MTKRSRIEDVAKQAQVSTATVSRVLSGVGVVSQKTRELVMQAVADLNYAPDASARALASGKTHTVGCVIPTLDHAIFAKSTQSLQKTLAASGYELLVASFEYDLEQELAVVTTLKNRGVDALILVGTDHLPELWASLIHWNKPALLTWSLDNRLPCIGFDNLAAGEFAADYLFDLGHRHIAVISGHTQNNDRARARVQGVRQAYKKRGLHLPQEYVIEESLNLQGGMVGLQKLMALAQAPTAIFCGNDLLASGALLEATRMGIVVPHDLSICGMDNHELSEALNPSLTTISLPTQLLGQLAAQFILDSLANKPVAHQTVLPFELLARQSTQKPAL